jgi:putative heme-binding domain-containing protein
MKCIRFLPSLVFSLGCWLVLLSPASAQRELKEIPDPDPELERKSFQVAPGFEVNLFAADPLLAKPIQMNFDAEGKLWVATSEVYPQIKPGQKANDKILVISDTRGVGKADKISVFADGLLIPTGIAPGDGGVYIANSTELLHLRDTDGDGKADSTRIVLSGFGTEDTHHILHSFQWGPEGFLYFNQSIYIHSHIETPYGVRRLGGGGVWQFRPDNLRLNVLAHGWVNPWGHQIDAWGQSFVTDGAGGEGINYVMPGASYAATPGATKILTGLNPGSPKDCGLEIVSGRNFPDDWQGDLITNDFRGHRVCRFKLSRDGAGYASQEMTELIKSTHPAFRPVDVKMGPDGALYIVDWYNPIIQHGEVDFRDPRRDHTHGRIWRVTAKNRPLVPPLHLVSSTPAELLEDLKAPETWTRTQAKRVMLEKHRGVMEPLLAKWVDSLDPTDPNVEHHQLEAAWTYQTLGKTRPDLLRKLLKANDPRVRAAATRILAHWQTEMPGTLALLRQTIEDAEPQVRLEGVRTLAANTQSEAVLVALDALDRPTDKFLDYALYTAVRDLQPHWFAAFQAGKLDFGQKPSHLQFALGAVASSEAVGPLLKQLRTGAVPGKQATAMWAMVANFGKAEDLQAVFARFAQQPSLTTADQLVLLDALETTARQRNVRPAGDLSGLSKLIEDRDEALRCRFLRLAGLWKLEALRPKLVSLSHEEANTLPVRQAAMIGLASLGGEASVRELDELARTGKPLSARFQAAIALTGINVDKAAARAAAICAAEPAGQDPAEMIQAILQQRQGPRALARELANAEIPADVAKLALRTIRASGRESKELIAAITKAGKLGAKRPAPNPSELATLVGEVGSQGDAARGESVYRRKELTCFKCHAIAGAGGQVGPDLISVGASAPVDYLIESLLVPNKAVKENYHSWVVATKDGLFFTGIKARESNTELVLRDAEDREIVIPTNKIESRTVAPSLMPEGLTDALTKGEFLDLVRFLSELGKGGLAVSPKVKVVRRWQTLDTNAAAYQLITRTTFASVTTPAPGLVWTSQYACVNGELPLAELPRFKFGLAFSKDSRFTAFLRCEVEASTPGEVELKLTAPATNLWNGTQPIAVTGPIRVNLRAGKNELTFAYELTNGKEPVRVEFVDVPGSGARYQIIGGK